MKTSHITLSMLIILIAGFLAFNSCRKKDTSSNSTSNNTSTNSAETETATADDNNLAENIANDIEAIGAEGGENETSLGNFKISGTEGILTSSCGTITTNPATQTFTVDFGSSGCTGQDGHTRKGMLIYDYSSSANGAAFYRNPGFIMSVSSQNYSVDNNTIIINNKIVANTTSTTIPLGPNPGTNLTWNIAANITIVRASNSHTVTWVCSRNKELLNTADTVCYKGQNHAIEWNHARVQWSGTANGLNGNGVSYTSVANNVVRYFQCSPDPNHPHRHPFISGTLVYTPGNHPTRTINYGNGACDLTATLAVGNFTTTITLP